MSDVRGPYPFYLRLLFDAELRGRFAANRARVLAEAGLTPEESLAFVSLDLRGLEIDAEGRARYLMSALCRPYPLSAGCLGALPGGGDALSAFLASDALFAPTGPRSAAFGAHLQGMLEARSADLGEDATGLIEAFLALERGLVANAQAMREASARGAPPAAPRPPTQSALKRGRVSLPPYFLAAQLPVPPQVLRGALEHIGPEDAWARIRSGSLDFDRVRAVARAAPTPVTFLARGVVRGMSAERAGAGGVAPIVEVTHLSAELSGLQGRLLGALQEGIPFREIPQALRGVVGDLARGGILAVDA